MLLIRRVLVAVLLSCCAVVVTGAPALACPPGKHSLEAQTKQAEDVFTGRVTGSRHDHRRVLYDVAVDRVYKGDIGAEAVSVSTSRSSKACGLPDLVRGGSYVFFASADGPDLSTDRISGTAPASRARVARVARLLGEGRPATPPEPAETTFTVVADEPADLDRVAAPGVALVIVGLLGLLFVAILGRRPS